MSILSKDIEGADPNPDVPQSPPITRYQQLADDFMKALDALAAGIPQLEVSHETTAKFVRGHQNVPEAFVATVVSAVEQSAELQGVGTLNATTARDSLQFIEAFRPVADKLAVFARTLRFTVDSRRATLNEQALQMYAIAKSVARNRGGAIVGQHARNMKRDLGKRGGRPKAKAPTPPAHTGHEAA